MHRELLVAGSEGAGLLEPSHAVLDEVSPPVRGLVELRLAPRSVGAALPLIVPLGDDRANVSPPQRGAYARVAVALVPGQVAGAAAGPPRAAAPDAHAVEQGFD